MLERSDFVSSQPENRTAIEEGLEFAWHHLLMQVEQPYPNLKQPLYTPAEFVSLLAGERGVLDWQPSDNEIQRRKTADRAFEIHRKAGTRAGLLGALSSLNIEANATKGSLPYSVIVDGRLSDLPLTADTSRRLNARVSHYKSERDTVSISLSRLNNGSQSRGCLIKTTRFVHVYAGIPKPPVSYGVSPRFGFIQSEKVIKVSAAAP